MNILKIYRQPMATLKELMGDLTRGNGRKFITNNSWFEPIFLDKYEDWYGLDNNQHGVAFYAYSIDTWEPYTEPKKKVKMYSPIYRNNSGIGYFMEDNWSSSKSDFDPLTINPIVGWQEMEVEVDE